MNPALTMTSLVATVAIATAACTDSASTKPTTATFTGPNPPSLASVVNVVDGDTIKVNLAGGMATVRLIGIDTPETRDPRKSVQCYGPQASARAHELLDGRNVRLEYDDTQPRTDKYGRTLAYIWIGNDLYNYIMVRDGYAHEYTYGKPYHFQAWFRQTQAHAKAAQIGFWSPATCNGDTTKPQP